MVGAALNLLGAGKARGKIAVETAAAVCVAVAIQLFRQRPPARQRLLSRQPPRVFIVGRRLRCVFVLIGLRIPARDL